LYGAESETHGTTRLVEMECSPGRVLSFEADDVLFYGLETESDILRGTRN